VGFHNISYLYHADWTKAQKIFGSTTTDYLDGFQYENEKLKFFQTSEGFYNAEREEYVYNYPDHLGNVRLSYSAADGGGAAVLEESNYYPFGLKHQGYNEGSLLNDYGARMYMPDIGRWGVMDDLSELQLHYSPYSYVYNNPIFFNDPTGMIPECPGGDCPKGVTDIITLPNGEKETQIQEVVVTGRKKAKSNLDLNKIAEFLTPIRPATPEETAMTEAKYGKYGQGIGSDLSIMWKQIKDIPNNLSDAWENIKSIGDSEDKEEAIIATAILLVNLKKGKIGNIAKMGVCKSTSGWVISKVFNSLDTSVQTKIKNAISKGIVAPTGQQGIIKLTATEAAQTGYQYKIKILGKGGDIRIYGNPNANGHIVFEKVMGH
jgi:RHS repeat-associated protein